MAWAPDGESVCDLVEAVVAAFPTLNKNLVRAADDDDDTEKAHC